MADKLFITTSNGIYLLDPESGISSCVLGNKHSHGILSKKARGYFGICLLDANHVLVSSREKLGLRKYNKPTTATRLFAIDINTLNYEPVATIRDVHDAHQIACEDGRVYITDTGKNRVIVYQLEQQSIERIVNVGERRDDINHINAVLIENGKLLIGLNNRGRESEILSIELEAIFSNTEHEVDGYAIGELISMNGVTHSHDLERCHGMLLCCSSNMGRVIDSANGRAIIEADNWVRGLAANTSRLWLGASFVTTRAKRHSKAIDGNIHQYSLPDYQLTGSHLLTGSGQVNDMILTHTNEASKYK